MGWHPPYIRVPPQTGSNRRGRKWHESQPLSRTFDHRLIRGASKKADLRRRFADLGDELVTVDVDGQPMRARAADAEEIAATPPV